MSYWLRMFVFNLLHIVIYLYIYITAVYEQANDCLVRFDKKKKMYTNNTINETMFTRKMFATKFNW